MEHIYQGSITEVCMDGERFWSGLCTGIWVLYSVMFWIVILFKWYSFMFVFLSYIEVCSIYFWKIYLSFIYLLYFIPDKFIPGITPDKARGTIWWYQGLNWDWLNKASFLPTRQAPYMLHLNFVLKPKNIL